MDIVAACSGFLYGLSVADAMIRGGQSKYTLVIGAEILTRYVTTPTLDLLLLAMAPAPPFWCGEGDSGIWPRKFARTGRYEEQLYAPVGAPRVVLRLRQSPAVIISSK